jgi:hypothetical protein
MMGILLDIERLVFVNIQINPTYRLMGVPVVMAVIFSAAAVAL